MEVTENHYLSNLLKYKQQENGEKGVLADLRSESAEKLQNTHFPTRKDEDWRFTNLKPLTRRDFVPVDEAGAAEAGDLSDYFIPESPETRLVFVNGHYSEEHSSIGQLPEGVEIGDLGNFDHQGNEVVQEHLNKYIDFEEDAFVPFNGAFAKHGAFVYVPDDTQLDAPIHLLHVNTDAEKPYFTTPRSLIVAGTHAEFTVIEDHIGLADNGYFTVPVMELKLNEGAHVKHVKIQRDSKQAVHVSRPVAHVAQHANYSSYTITLGAWLSRNDPKVVQTDPEVDFTVDGLVLIDGYQIADTHSTMDHRFHHGNSHQLHKCVINGEAHSIFNGKIHVRRDAQKIDSFQENRNLLLSSDGQVNTKPQLEIFADDVVCSHGATIGQLDQDEVFYLNSRGLSEQKARELLTYAFALETIKNVKVKSVHELLLKEVERYNRSQQEVEEVA